MIVIDACVIAKTYLEEPDSDKAHQLLDTCDEIVVPHIVRVEVASAITRGFRNGNIKEADARLAYARWKKHTTERWFKLIPNEEVLDAAVALSLKLKHPVADCLYLSVAQKFRMPLITADRVFHQRCRKHFKKLRLLSET